MDDAFHPTPSRRQAHPSPDPEMVESGSKRGRRVVGDEGREATRGSGGRSIPATGREPGGIPQQVAGSSRSARYRRTTADFATPGEGSSRWRQHDYAAPFDPDSAIRARVKRITRPVFRCHRIKAEPRLSFAFGESSVQGSRIYMNR